MRAQALTTPSASTDPLGNSADAMGGVLQAVKQGAAEAQARISESSSTVGNLLNRLLYRSSYMLSFGVVFPVMLVVRVVPKNNAIVHGLIDGASAARDQVAGLGAGSATEVIPEEPAQESLIAANGATDGETPAEANHRRRGTRRSGSSHTAPKRSNRKK